MNEPNINGKKTVGRSTSGRFAKGNKASSGRPRGSGVVAEMRVKLAQDMDAIIDRLRQLALAGDTQAMRILFDRVLPSLRPVELPVVMAMPDDNLAQQARAVLHAVAMGDLAPAQSAQIMASLAGVAKIIETTDLLARIEKLEAQRASP